MDEGTKTKIETLAGHLIEVKKKEKALTEYRRKVEADICDLLPGDVDASVKAVAGNLEIKVKRGLDYKVDAEALALCPDDLAYPVRYKPEVDAKQYKKILEMNGRLASLCQTFITTKPSKPSVEVTICPE